MDNLPKISSSAGPAAKGSDSSFQVSFDTGRLEADFLSCSFRFRAICSLTDNALGDDGVGDTDGDGGGGARAALSVVGVLDLVVDRPVVLSFGADVFVLRVGVAAVRVLRVVRALPLVVEAAAEVARGVAEVVRGRGTRDEDIKSQVPSSPSEVRSQKVTLDKL